MTHRQRIVDRGLDTGRAWISTTTLDGQPTIKTCITSHRTTYQVIDELIELLHKARS